MTCGTGPPLAVQCFSQLAPPETAIPSLSKRIVEHACSLPEAVPICAGTLLHLGNRAAVDQALSRLARSGRLLRICQGVYMRPVETRFGPCAPSVDKALNALADLWNETIVPCGGAAAHVLGLTTQVPVRSVYLTSGPGRRLRFGNLDVELRHAPRWQLAAPHHRGGRSYPGPGLARAGRGPIGAPSPFTRPVPRGYRPARRGAGDHAALDGGAREHAGRADGKSVKPSGCDQHACLARCVREN